jgi:hypothetical protein
MTGLARLNSNQPKTMLYKIASDQLIERIPYEQEYHRWRNRLTHDQYRGIEEELNRRLDQVEVITSSWVPGSDWTGTVFEPIYTSACFHDQEEAAKCFGLFLWVTVQRRADAWMCDHYELNDVPIRGLTYFRVQI